MATWMKLGSWASTRQKVPTVLHTVAMWVVITGMAGGLCSFNYKVHEYENVRGEERYVRTVTDHFRVPNKDLRTLQIKGKETLVSFPLEIAVEYGICASDAVGATDT